MPRVIIADDVLLLRSGLKSILEQDSEIEVIALAADGREAYELSRELHPDCVLMDMRMAGTDGETGTRLIKSELPEVKVLVLTTFDDERTVSAALSSGADGYILKETDEKGLIGAVKSVSAGVKVFGGNVYESLVKKFTDSSAVPAKDFGLTEREREIIALVAAGKDNREIAAELYLAEGTVRNQVSRLLEKLRLKDRTQLAVFAVKNNLDSLGG